jgi:hypothetical protein
MKIDLEDERASKFRALKLTSPRWFSSKFHALELTTLNLKAPSFKYCSKLS